jgi:hypothetical protein
MTRFEYTGASVGRIWTYRKGEFREFAGFLCFCEDYAESVVLGKEAVEQFDELSHPFYVTVHRDNGKSLRVHPMHKDGVLPIARELARMTGQEIHVEFGDSITERVVTVVDGQICEVPSGAHIEEEYKEYYTL